MNGVTAIPERSFIGVQPLGANVTFEWLHGGKIAVFNVPEAVRVVVEVYMDGAEKLVQQWPVNEPFLMLCDSGKATSTFSMHMRERVERLIKSPEFGQLTGRFAIVLPKSLILQIVRLFMLGLRPQIRGPEPRIFFKRADALQWLEECL